MDFQRFRAMLAKWALLMYLILSLLHLTMSNEMEGLLKLVITSYRLGEISGWFAETGYNQL